METCFKVDDKPHCAGIMVDAIGYCKIAIDSRLWPLVEVSHWFMKHSLIHKSVLVDTERTDNWLSGASEGLILK